MKAKHIIALTGILLFFAGSVFVLHKASSALQKKEERYATFPKFHLPDLNGEIFYDTSIDRNKATLFYFFDPDCSLCHEMLESLKIRYNDFFDYKILLITVSPKERIKEYFDEIDFRPSENIKILYDENAELFFFMDIKGPPTSFIYKNAILVKRFDGPVRIETLINYLQ